MSGSGVGKETPQEAPTENVFALNQKRVRPIDSSITAEIIKPDALGGIRSYVDVAQKTLESTSPGPDSLKIVNGEISTASLTEDQQYAMAELEMLLAKHGKTPASSVEGIIQLRRMVVEAYRDNELVPQSTKFELIKIEREIGVLEETYGDFLEKRRTQAKEKTLKAEKELLATQRKLEAEHVRIETERRKSGAQVLRSEVEAEESLVEDFETRVSHQRRKGIATNDTRVLGRQLDNDQLRKAIDARTERAAIVWTSILLPITKVLKRVIFWGILIAVVLMVFSFLVEVSGLDYPLLDPFNRLWHLLVDPIWGAIQSLVREA